ncbi:hypothetical protein SAMD00019534_090630 [Acytostelium subglobosum LB1]|uniref:hypothetical protein n=1 Tax=Acytostelium subglobosum LB1 TaxID=1410327 RepID=UPI00064486DC|nr:hypothetical protein SAMD00019534_090630 [Acytostelium subglobosum LB1]GAM25888.1 hypothetical protein SAMD00019534_090630 [Acytostelium subglobosum LB1]|eukprot:XP_012750931.1 hypothetical protein SAMD00019534_090630 [Acytostelium subglobosum LB1]
MPNKAHAPMFWKSIANTFGNNGRILFDLYNEPYPYGNAWDTEEAWTCWKNGTDCEHTIDYPVAGMQEMIDSIRGVGATNIILLSGIQYATSLTQFLTYIPFDPLKQLGAALHSYDFNYCRSKGCWDIYLKPVLDQYPIVATEVGQKDCQTDFLLDFINYCDANNLHYIAWSWLVADCSTPSLIRDYIGTPTTFGRGYKTHLNTLDAGQTPFHSDTFDIYNDKMTHWADDWSSAKHILNNTSPVIEGKYSIAFRPRAKGETLFFMCWSCINTSIHKQVEFWVHGGQSGKQLVDFNLLTLNSDKTVNIAYTRPLTTLIGRDIPAGQWIKVYVDLRNLTSSPNSKFDGFQLVSTTSDQTDMYIDKITVRAFVDPTPPSSSSSSESTASTQRSSNVFVTLLLTMMTIILYNLASQ